jgi:signal transduction histidine kinase
MNFLSKAKNNVDRLGRLINDVLDLSKLEAGKSDLKRELLNINSVIKEASEFHDSQAKKQGLELKFELDESLPYILIDKDRISQVMSNLLSNAIRYTEKGSVTVKSEKTADGVYVKVSVIDTGVGIKMEDYQKLFSKFQQVGEAIERKQGGTGLGLAICHELVHMHNGKIDVKSEYGKGSCFYFILPIDERRS